MHDATIEKNIFKDAVDEMGVKFRFDSFGVNMTTFLVVSPIGHGSRPRSEILLGLV